jgi:hypothetical protein
MGSSDHRSAAAASGEQPRKTTFTTSQPGKPWGLLVSSFRCCRSMKTPAEAPAASICVSTFSSSLAVHQPFARAKRPPEIRPAGSRSAFPCAPIGGEVGRATGPNGVSQKRVPKTRKWDLDLRDEYLGLFAPRQPDPWVWCPSRAEMEAFLRWPACAGTTDGRSGQTRPPACPSRYRPSVKKCDSSTSPTARVGLSSVSFRGLSAPMSPDARLRFRRIRRPSGENSHLS